MQRYLEKVNVVLFTLKRRIRIREVTMALTDQEHAALGIDIKEANVSMQHIKKLEWAKARAIAGHEPSSIIFELMGGDQPVLTIDEMKHYLLTLFDDLITQRGASLNNLACPPNQVP
jgi:hypothetical protein